MKIFLTLVLGCVLLIPLEAVHGESGTLFMRPDRASYSVDDGLVVELYVNTGGADIQAVEASLTFDPSGLQVDKIVTENSILTSWPTAPTYSNDAGTITFSGWTDAKYSGKDGYLASVYFRTPRNSPGKLTYESGAILAADGVGSNIIGTMRSGVYTVAPTSEVVQTEDLAPIEDNISLSAKEDADAQISPETPSRPLISQYSKTILEGERIEVKGTTSPNSKIIVYLTHADGAPEQATLSSESDGAFTFTSPVGTEVGVYRVWAVQESIDGVKSEPTDKIAITVRPSTIAAVGAAVTSVGALVIPFFLFVVIIGLSLGYYFYTRGRARVQSSSHL